MESSKPELSDLPSLLNLTIEQASEGLQSGRFTSVDLVNAYLARIDEVAEFNVALEINPDVLSTASELDDERQYSGSRGSLHGIPILVKDNIITQDALEASSGSFALLGAKPAAEASVVARLRAAGVLILGKSNLSEWANMRGLNLPSGWSARGGQTLGAYYPNADPDGSSSGSAVGTALGLCAAALGTETQGSITYPAELNNVVGFKPTRGLIATDGVVPVSKRQDVIGTLTRTVKDAAYMLTHMAGRSDMDERTWNIPFDPIPDFSTFCNNTDLTGLRIGVPRNGFDSDALAPIIPVFESALSTFRSAGATVVDNANFSAAEEYHKLSPQAKGIVMLSEFKSDMAAYLRSLETNPNDLHSVEDIIEFTKTCEGEEYPSRDMNMFLYTRAQGVDVGSGTYKHMLELERYFGGEGGILGAMREHNLDVLVMPSTQGIANDLAAKMGFPIMAVPLGFWPEGTPVEKGVDGLVSRAPGVPFCLILITEAFADAKLIRVAHAFEQLTAVREKGPLPIKLPKTELWDVIE